MVARACFHTSQHLWIDPAQGDHRRGAVCNSSCTCCFQYLAKYVVAWPRVSSLAGIRNKRAFITLLSSRSKIPVFGGLRSSSAERSHDREVIKL